MAMALAGKGGRGGRRSRRSGTRPMSEINVTPMVDVMLVLLIVFMVAAPLLTVGVPIDLPQTAAKELNTESKPITVTIKSEGDIYLQDQPVALEDLIAQLGALAQSSDERILVRGDSSADYGTVMKVMGVLSAASYSKIGLITDKAPGQ